MKTSILSTALIAITCISFHLKAQEVSSKSTEANLEKKVRCIITPTDTGFSITFENKIKSSMDDTANKAYKKGYDYYQAMSAYSVSSVDNSVTEVISPRDAASGMPSGKRQHKPRTVKTDIDKSTPGMQKSVSPHTKITTEGSTSRGTIEGSEIVNLKDITLTKRCSGETTSILLEEGVYTIPTADCPNGNCNVKINYTWPDGSYSDADGTSQKNKSIDFVLKIEEGVCTAMALNEKRLPRGKAKN